VTRTSLSTTPAPSGSGLRSRSTRRWGGRWGGAFRGRGLGERVFGWLVGGGGRGERKGVWLVASVEGPGCCGGTSDVEHQHQPQNEKQQIVKTEPEAAATQAANHQHPLLSPPTPRTQRPSASASGWVR